MPSSLIAPTWVLTAPVGLGAPYWGISGDESALYPSVRVFRQRSANDGWAPVMREVAAAFAEWPAVGELRSSIEGRRYGIRSLNRGLQYNVDGSMGPS